MRKRMFFTRVLIITVSATFSLFSLFLVDTGTAQEEKEPCPKSYIKTIYLRTGKPGEKVKIRGRRFGTEPGEVFFNPNVKANVLEWTNTRIWVIVPRSATSGRVTISIPCGAVSNTSYFKVIE